MQFATRAAILHSCSLCKSPCDATSLSNSKVRKHHVKIRIAQRQGDKAKLVRVYMNVAFYMFAVVLIKIKIERPSSRHLSAPSFCRDGVQSRSMIRHLYAVHMKATQIEPLHFLQAPMSADADMDYWPRASRRSFVCRGKLKSIIVISGDQRLTSVRFSRQLIDVFPGQMSVWSDDKGMPTA